MLLLKFAYHDVAFQEEADSRHKSATILLVHFIIIIILFVTAIKVIIKIITTISIAKVLACTGTAANLLVMVVILGHRRVRRL